MGNQSRRISKYAVSKRVVTNLKLKKKFETRDSVGWKKMAEVVAWNEEKKKAGGGPDIVEGSSDR